jgi:protein SCO1/2
MRKRATAWLLTLLIAVTLPACRPSTAPPPFKGVDLTGSPWGRDFALADHRGEPRRLADFRGKVVLLSFGYLNCPDVCPTTLATLAETMKLLGAEAEKVQVLFVTVDPERDSAERLAGYVPWFDARFVGLRGDVAATAAVAAEFRVFYQKRNIGSAGGYAMDHTAGAYVFDPQGRLRLLLRHGATAEDMAADLRLLLAGN